MIKVTKVALLLGILAVSACQNADRFGDGGVDGAGGPNGSLNGLDQVTSANLDPASPAYFQQTVGDRVLFAVDQSTLSEQGRTTLAGQAGWLNANPEYTAIIEGHADEQGTRDYKPGPGRPSRRIGPRFSGQSGDPRQPSAHGDLWQGASDRSVFIRKLLCPEPPRRYGDHGGCADQLRFERHDPPSSCCIAVAARVGPGAGRPDACRYPAGSCRSSLSKCNGLRRELSTTGTPGVALGGTSALERIDAMEAELRRLTGRTEELENRINRVVADGTNRVGDLEFRLCELEQGCEIGSLGLTPNLGGDDGVAPPAATPPCRDRRGAIGDW